MRSMLWKSSSYTTPGGALASSVRRSVWSTPCPWLTSDDCCLNPGGLLNQWPGPMRASRLRNCCLSRMSRVTRAQHRPDPAWTDVVKAGFRARADMRPTEPRHFGIYLDWGDWDPGFQRRVRILLENFSKRPCSVTPQSRSSSLPFPNQEEAQLGLYTQPYPSRDVDWVALRGINCPCWDNRKGGDAETSQLHHAGHAFLRWSKHDWGEQSCHEVLLSW